MANELLIGVKIGAALSGTFQSAFASARGTAARLGQVADELRLKHNRLGDAMARAMSHPTRNVAELKRQYDRLGLTLDQLRSKQERLTASLARGETLKANRSELRGQAMETAGTALALMAPVVKSGNVAIDFQDQLRDVAITGEFSKAEEAKLGSTIRDAALKWNQFQDEIARGTSVLVAGGIQDAKALEKYAPVMAKAATATRASMDDLGSVAIALKDNLKVGEDGFEGALNMLLTPVSAASLKFETWPSGCRRCRRHSKRSGSLARKPWQRSALRCRLLARGLAQTTKRPTTSRISFRRSPLQTR